MLRVLALVVAFAFLGSRDVIAAGLMPAHSCDSTGDVMAIADEATTECPACAFLDDGGDDDDLLCASAPLTPGLPTGARFGEPPRALPAPTARPPLRPPV